MNIRAATGGDEVGSELGGVGMCLRCSKNRKRVNVTQAREREWKMSPERQREAKVTGS